MTERLSTGLRLNIRPMAACPVEVCGLAVDAGSRDEEPRQHGLAHFVEHTLFKGARHRPAWAVNSCMERVGGELNAYTSKEETIIYTVAPAGYAERAVALLADLVCDPTFPAAEVEREREVVRDEISSYLDTPSEAVFDDFEELAYAGSSAAHNILGSAETIDSLTPADCRAWVEHNYSPGRMLFFYCGPGKPERIAHLAQKHLGHLRRPDAPRLLRREHPPVGFFNTIKDIEVHQAHTVMGARIGGLASADRPALALLTNILGGPGANSLLNIQLREKRGLVYAVDASTALLTDAGLLTIYFGCDDADTARCLRLVESEVARLGRHPLSPARLAAAKRQFLGQQTVASLNVIEDTLGAARLLLHGAEPMTRQMLEERIQAITADDLCRLASGLRLSRLTLR